MISPDILKRSTLAGAVSVAVVGGVAAIAPIGLCPDAEGDRVESSEEGIEAALDSRSRMPQPVIRKAPPVEGESSSTNREESSDAARAEARRRATQRAMEQLEVIYETHGPVTGAPDIEVLRIRVDRALETAENHTASEFIRR